MEMIALAEAFEEEQNQLRSNKSNCHQIQLKLRDRKRKMQLQRKYLNDVAKSLMTLEKRLTLKLHDMESITKVNNQSFTFLSLS